MTKAARRKKLRFAIDKSVMADRPPPSALAVAFGSAIIAGLAGYFLGQASAIGVFSNKPLPSSAAAGSAGGSSGKNKQKANDDESDISDAKEASDLEDEDEDDEQELNRFEGSNEECKLVLVVRTDLGMTKGEPESRTCRHVFVQHHCRYKTDSDQKSLLSDYRQDCGSVWTRDAGMLQDVIAPELPSTKAVGKLRPGKGCFAG